MNTLSTELFEYNPDSKHFAAFDSELPGVPGNAFILKSQWTGKGLVFVLRESVKDVEGDTQLWRYTPEDLTYSALSLTVYND